jgi:hypothetical protein
MPPAAAAAFLVMPLRRAARIALLRLGRALGGAAGVAHVRVHVPVHPAPGVWWTWQMAHHGKFDGQTLIPVANG